MSQLSPLNAQVRIVDPKTGKPTTEFIRLFAALVERANILDEGWADPTGTSDKSTFATSTVTTQDLAEFVKAMYEALKAKEILSA